MVKLTELIVLKEMLGLSQKLLLWKNRDWVGRIAKGKVTALILLQAVLRELGLAPQPSGHIATLPTCLLTIGSSLKARRVPNFGFQKVELLPGLYLMLMILRNVMLR